MTIENTIDLMAKWVNELIAEKNRNSDVEAKIYEALTVQALRIRSEMFRNSRTGDFDVKVFDNEYLSNLGEYERALAKKEGIELKEW